jgi:hypothetical protein
VTAKNSGNPGWLCFILSVAQHGKRKPYCLACRPIQYQHRLPADKERNYASQHPPLAQIAEKIAH